VTGVAKDVLFVLAKFEELSNVPIGNRTGGVAGTSFDATVAEMGFVDELH